MSEVAAYSLGSFIGMGIACVLIGLYIRWDDGGWEAVRPAAYCATFFGILSVLTAYLFRG
jgi:hypothetical protein